MALLRDLFAGIFETLQGQYTSEIDLPKATLPQVPDQIPHIELRFGQIAIQTNW